jgi:Na+/citrate or Na+/malate symporter
MIATLAVGGFLCAWLGSIIPALHRLGAPAITAAFLPSYLVYRHWLPDDLVDTVTTFTKGTNFIYLYITAIIVGSILGMDRRLLLSGIMKIFVPLIAGSVAALMIASLVSLAIGVPLSNAIPMIIVPVMAGGVGEGAIPLSLGYSEIYHQSSSDILSHLLPVVLFANLVAILLAGILNSLGRRYPALTGSGELDTASVDLLKQSASNKKTYPLTLENFLGVLLYAISLYLLGLLSHQFLAIPAPITMLVLAVLCKLSNLMPAWFDHATALVGKFFAVSVTYPLLFAVAIAMTPWVSVKAALQPQSLILITLVVLTLTLTGFFVGRWMGLFPIESALINACHTGAGGTGNVAILTASERLNLMPFAQIATRIGGAITVTLTLLILRLLAGGH